MDGHKVRFVPLGGIVGVTKNMYLYELYKGEELTDILVVDCGIGFTKEKDLGVDYVIPDISYLHDKKDKIRAVLLTHGHDDHISALKFHYKDMGSPPVYADKLTAVFTESKCAEFNINLKVNVISYRKDYVFGPLKARFIHLTHSIPDTTHILITTPIGSFYHGSDFKIDLTPPYWDAPDFFEIARAGEEGVICLFTDCLGAEREGYTLSESVVAQTFEDEMRMTKGKFIMTTFSSNISRIRQCVEVAVKFNRKVCFLGRSMNQNFEMARTIGYMPFNNNQVISDRKVRNLRPNQVCIIAAGAQGQFDSALSKIAQGKHRFVSIEPGDKVVFSSDPIPGQEEDVYETIEELMMKGAKVVYSDIAEQLHASGHGNQEDLKLLVRLTKPRYIIPIGGTIRHQRSYSLLMQDVGYQSKDIFLLQEGQTMVFEQGKVSPGPTIDTKTLFVDAYGIGDVGSMVLRDRKALSKEGFVIGVVTVDKNYAPARPIDFISRGFIFGENEQVIFDKATRELESVLSSHVGQPFESSKLSHELINKLEMFFSKETGRRPLVIMQILQV